MSARMRREVDSFEIRTDDGRGLGAQLIEPRGRRILGTVVFAHPMFANKSVFSRPRGAGVVDLFCEAGWRTLAFDFRGHGESTVRGEKRRADEAPWGYDELVRVDLPTVVRAARARWPRSKLVVVGHSLGGHVALAAQSAGLIGADALVLAAANIWMRRLESSRRVWLAKLATITAMAGLAAGRRYFPVRALRLGSDDEASPYMRDLARFAVRGEWKSRDGETDYEAGLPRISTPTFALTSAGDRLYCRPESCQRLLSSVRQCVHHRIDSDDAGGPAPGHIAIVTEAQSRSGWNRALDWLAETAPPRGT